MTAISVIISLLLALWLIWFVYSRQSLSKLSIAMEFSQKRATEGDVLVLSTVLANAKWLPLPWVAVKFHISKYLQFADSKDIQVSDDYYRNDLYHILMYQKITRRFEFLCTKRGYYRLKSLDITAWDILMSTKYASHVDCDASLIVYPSFLPVPEINELCTRINGHIQAKRFIHPDPFTFRGIREYAPNDPLKAINFKATAKAQTLMVNLWDFTISRQVVLMLNLEWPKDWRDDNVAENAIKIAASLAKKLTDAHIPVRFITNSNKLSVGSGARHLEQILEILALIDLESPSVEPFAPIFSEAINSNYIGHSNKQQGEPQEFWLISAYQGADLKEVYDKTRSLGNVLTAWIDPSVQGKVVLL